MLHADPKLCAGQIDVLTRLLCGAGGGLGAVGDVGDGSRQLLHRAGLVDGTLAEALGTVGHLPAGGGHLSGGGVDLVHGAAQLALEGVNGLQNALELAHVGLLMGGADGEVFPGHLCEQIGDVVYDGVQALYQLLGGADQLGRLILALGLGHRRA